MKLTGDLIEQKFLQFVVLVSRHVVALPYKTGY